MRQDSTAPSIGGSALQPSVPPHLEIARLREHPQFPAAVRATATGLAEIHSRSRLVGWFLSDRALAVLAHIAVCLDADMQEDDPRSGLTPGRFKLFCLQTGLCSEGRAAAILAYMRLSGQLEAASHPADRRITRLRPSHKMVETMRTRLRAQYAGAALVCPQVAPTLDLLGEPEFERELCLEFLHRYSGGARLLQHAPDMRLFLERDVGALILFGIMLQADPSAPVPPDTPLPLSIAALSRRFRVSRTHVLRLIREAEAAALLERVGDKGELVRFSPRLRRAVQDLMAASFQLAALCAEAALQRIGALAATSAR